MTQRKVFFRQQPKGYMTITWKNNTKAILGHLYEVRKMYVVILKSGPQNPLLPTRNRAYKWARENIEGGY